MNSESDLLVNDEKSVKIYCMWYAMGLHVEFRHCDNPEDSWQHSTESAGKKQPRLLAALHRNELRPFYARIKT